MSGFGIRTTAETQRAIEGFDDPILWRPESFLHQLSLQGAMLWAGNHDRVWGEMLAPMLGQSAGELSWPEARELLASAPAAEARKILYKTSALWLRDAESARPEIEEFLLTQGLDAPAALQSLDREIALRRRQLAQMRWCLRGSAGGSERAIEIIR